MMVNNRCHYANSYKRGRNMTNKRSFLHLVSITYGVMLMLLILICLLEKIVNATDVIDKFNDIMVPTTITFAATIVLPALEDKSNTPRYGVYLLMLIIGCALMYIADFSIAHIVYSLAEICVTAVTIWFSALVYFEMNQDKNKDVAESGLSGKEDNE